MTRLAAPSVLSIALLFSLLPSGIAGPACARRNWQANGCIARCQSKWGWPGSAMGTNPWGPVMTPEAVSMSSVVSQACGTPTSAAGQSSSTTLPSQPAMAVPPAPTATTSSPVSSSPSASRNSTASSSSSAPSPTGNEAPVVTSSSSSKTSSSSSTSPTQKTSAAPSPPATSATPTPSPSSSQSSSSASSAQASSGSSDSSTSSSDEQQYLFAHNSFRAQYGAAPLTWNNTLASKAQQWANNCQFQHSGGSLGPFGENLAAGTGDSYDIAAGIKSWTDESSQYDPSNPVASHFTQVVWKASTQLGCAEAQCSGIFSSSFGLAKFFVCEYSPQGNVIGQFAQNVQA